MEVSAPVEGGDLLHQRPGLAAEGAGVHGQGTSQGAGDTGQELRPHQPLATAEAGQPGTAHAGLRLHPRSLQAAHPVQRPLQGDHRAGEAAVTHQQVAPQPHPHHRHLLRKVGEKPAQILQIRGAVPEARRPAGPPGDVARHGLLLPQFAPQRHVTGGLHQ